MLSWLIAGVAGAILILGIVLFWWSRGPEVVPYTPPELQWVTKEQLEEAIDLEIRIYILVGDERWPWTPVRVVGLPSPDSDGVNWAVESPETGPMAQRVADAVERCQSLYRLLDEPASEFA